MSKRILITGGAGFIGSHLADELLSQGVEAVSNGVAAFKPPTVRRAHRTLTIIVTVLALLLLGIARLSRSYHISAMDQDQPGYQSVISQMLGAVVGRNWLYFVTIISVLAVLCLSANTSFVGFPRLCRLIAAHDFLPRGFTIVGRRLVYSVGVVSLAILAGVLLVVFRGITDRLIPLFAVGAFMAFSLSQAGMVAHWWRESRKARDRDKSHALIRLTVNGIGTVTTTIALGIILAAKFLEGAWICVVVIPLLLTMFRLIHGHYQRMERQMTAVAPLDLSHNQPPVVLVTTKGWDRLTEKALRFAFWLSTDVIALHLHNLSGEEAAEGEQRLHEQWHDNVALPAQRHGVRPPRLDVMPAPYRSFTNPIMQEIDRLEQEFPMRQIAVLTPQIVEKYWWNFFLHRQKSTSLRAALRRRGDQRVVLISVPWYVAE